MAEEEAAATAAVQDTSQTMIQAGVPTTGIQDIQTGIQIGKKSIVIIFTNLR